MSLILTRELDQTIEVGSPWGFPTTIKIQDITNKQVRLAIDGPSAVQVNRGEVADSLRARTELMPPSDPVNFSLVQHLCVQSKWSLETFGPGPMVERLLDHIEKEIVEVRKAPGDVVEWIDIIALAFDGAMRCGGVTAEEVVAALDAKAAVVRERSYPPIADRQPSKAVHHLDPNDANRSIVADAPSELTPSAPASAQAGDEPDPALLISMATCLNHGFGMMEPTRQQYMLDDMRKLWNEVKGRGYYSPERSAFYLGMLGPVEDVEDSLCVQREWDSDYPHYPRCGCRNGAEGVQS